MCYFRRRTQGNSKSLKNGQNTIRRTEFDSEYSHPYDVTKNTGSVGDSKQHLKSSG